MAYSSLIRKMGWVAVLCVLLCLSACNEADEPRVMPVAENTLFMYFPWAEDLTPYFERNISDMEKSAKSVDMSGQRIVVYFADSEATASLFEIVCENGQIRRETLKTYHNPETTTAEGVALIFLDVKSFAPARSYSMTIGSHGMGWIPVDRSTETVKQRMLRQMPHAAGMPTRYFGGLEPAHQIDVAEFAYGISLAGLHFDFILFDDCYMSSVEAAYDLREATDRIVASPCEIMAFGLPYDRVGPHLLGDADLNAVCDEFIDFYTSYPVPCGTLAVIDCRELDELAALMKTANLRYELTSEQIADVQSLDCFSPPVFFDLGDYAAKLCASDATLSAAIQLQLSAAVPYEVHTPNYYTSSTGYEKLSTCSGISVSDPSVNALASEKTATAWWQATH